MTSSSVTSTLLGYSPLNGTRTDNKASELDSTVFSPEGADLFKEKPWKGIDEAIPFGPQAISLDIGFPTF
jgi:hypothetical protein